MGGTYDIVMAGGLGLLRRDGKCERESGRAAAW